MEAKKEKWKQKEFERLYEVCRRERGSILIVTRTHEMEKQPRGHDCKPIIQLICK